MMKYDKYQDFVKPILIWLHIDQGVLIFPVLSPLKSQMLGIGFVLFFSSEHPAI